MTPLRAYRQTLQGLPDLLNYAAMVDDGVLLNKDGSFTAGFFYRGKDNASAVDSQIGFVRDRINNVFAKLDGGWMLHIDSIRMPSSDYPSPARNHFTQSIPTLIEAERRKMFQAEGSHYESMFALFLTWMPPREESRKIVDLMFQKDDSKQKVNRQQENLDFFNEQIGMIADGLSAVVQIHQMRGYEYVDEFDNCHIHHELLQYLHYCITGNNIPVNLPDCPMYLDTTIGAVELNNDIPPVLDGDCIGVVSIDEFPAYSHPLLFQALDQLPCEYRWSTRFIVLPASKAVAEVKKQQRFWEQKELGVHGLKKNKKVKNIDQDAASMSSQLNNLVAMIKGGDVCCGRYTSTLQFRAPDPDTLQEYCKYAKKHIENLGFSARIETINTLEGFLGSLPGHSQQNVRKPLLHSKNVADLMPVAGVWAGHEHCPCPFYPAQSPPLLYAKTHGSTPFRLNLHVGDLAHTQIVGPTGAGKSTLLALMIMQFQRYPGARVFCFDKDMSMFATIKASGGKHFELGGNNSLAFCPLDNIESQADRAWAEQWIESLLTHQNINVSAEHRSAIHEAMGRVLSVDTPGCRSLTDFRISLQNQTLQAALEFYTSAGKAGHLLDSEQDHLSMSDMLCFEMNELLGMKDDKVSVPILEYLFWRIEKSLDGSPTMLVIEEAWLMLSHPLFSPKIRDWLKTLRKKNCFVILATQSLSDTVGSGIMDVLQESCPTKIFLPNPEATAEGAGNMPGPIDFYRSYGLNGRQIQIIAGARQKREYYVTSSEGRRLVDLGLEELALSFVAASDKVSIARIKELEAEHGDQWPYAWMQEKGVDYDQYL